MTIILGTALVLLGLAIGFIIAWTFGAGISTGLAIGLLLLIAGVTIGYITEWLIDEAYRRNQELRRQLSERNASPVIPGTDLSSENPGNLTASETLADFLRQRDEELRELRDKVVASESRVDVLQNEFEAYQQTHPDDLTVIKGIGPVYQWKLRDIGVGSYKQLASADPDQLRRMLDIKNWQRVDIHSWIEQARDWAQRGNNA
jgi:predicted flap endonuclease-1-like 5' DNA nuclease